MKLTSTSIRESLKGQPFRLDTQDQGAQVRSIECPGAEGAIKINEFKRWPNIIEFRIVWYTGNPAMFWDHKTVATLKEVVEVVKSVKDEAIRHYNA